MALATISDFSSGVKYKWCGSFPVGIRFFSVQVAGSITLTLPSSELRTNTGAGCLASTGPARLAQKTQSKSLENAQKRITGGFQNRTQV